MTGPRNATTTSNGRTYTWRGQTFPSVTTIIEGGLPKQALIRWAAKATAEFAVANIDEVAVMAAKNTFSAVDWCKKAPWRERDAAGEQGTDIHNWAEAYVHGQDPAPPPKAQQAYVDGFLAFLDDWRPSYEMTESTVYSCRFGYAGTLDAIATINGERWLLDYKSGKSVHNEVSLQLAAYRHADFVGMADGTEEPVPLVDRCGVLHLTPDGYHLIPVQAGEAELRFFRYVREVRSFLVDHSRDVIGAPLTAPTREEVPA